MADSSELGFSIDHDDTPSSVTPPHMQAGLSRLTQPYVTPPHMQAGPSRLTQPYVTPAQMQARTSFRPTSPVRTAYTLQPLSYSGSAVGAVQAQEAKTSKENKWDIYGRDQNVIFRRHQTMDKVFDRHRGEFEKLVLGKSMQQMRDYIYANFNKHVWLDFLNGKLRQIVQTFATEDQKQAVLENDWNIDTMLRVVQALLEDCQNNRALMDISFGFPETADEVAMAIDRSRKRTREVIRDLQTTIRNQQEDINLMKDEFLVIKELRAQLEAAKNYILYNQNALEGKIPAEEEFMRDLECQLRMHENLNSSLQEQLEQERLSNEEILNKFLESEAKRVQNQNQQLVEIAETVKLLEMQDIFRDGVVERIQSLAPNPAEVEKAVNDWLLTINEAVERKSDRVYKLVQELKTLNHMEANHEEIIKQKQGVLAEYEQLDEKIQRKGVEYAHKLEELKEVSEQVDAIAEHIRLKSDKLKFLKQIDVIGDKETTLRMLENREATIENQIDLVTYDNIMKIKELDLLEKRAKDIESRHGELVDRYHTVKPKYRFQQKFSIIEEEGAKRKPADAGPGGYRELKQVASARAKYFANKHLRRSSDDVLRRAGEMSPALSPGYTQETVNRELQVLFGTPKDFSQGSWPHSPPKVEVVPPTPTIPGVRTNEAGSPLQEIEPVTGTFSVTSPRREEPLLVHVGIAPKPLTDTERGEVFTCDVSLNIEPNPSVRMQQPAITISESVPTEPSSPTSISERRRRQRAGKPWIQREIGNF